MREIFGVEDLPHALRLIRVRHEAADAVAHERYEDLASRPLQEPEDLPQLDAAVSEGVYEDERGLARGYESEDLVGVLLEGAEEVANPDRRVPVRHGVDLAFERLEVLPVVLDVVALEVDRHVVAVVVQLLPTLMATIGDPGSPSEYQPRPAQLSI